MQRRLISVNFDEGCYFLFVYSMGAGTGGAGWASAHPGKNQGGHGPPWKF